MINDAAFQLTPVTPGEAQVFSGWTYGPGYRLYDMAKRDIANLIDPELLYYAVRRDASLVGFACFGQDARITGGPYRQPAQDFGCALAPELCGQGQGLDFITAIARFASQTFQPALLRLSVAITNHRAIKTYERGGFAVGQRFAGMTHGGTHTFRIMTRTPLTAPPG